MRNSLNGRTIWVARKRPIDVAIIKWPAFPAFISPERIDQRKEMYRTFGALNAKGSGQHIDRVNTVELIAMKTSND